MRKLFLISAAAMTLGSTSFAGQAAETASLTVSGSVAPSTCDISLATSSVEFGTVTSGNLMRDLNQLSGNDIKVNVGCDAPAAVVVQATDNRASSAMTAAEVQSEMKATIPFSDANFFGLGTDSENGKVGALVLAVTASTLDGSPNSHLLSSTDKVTWTAKNVSADAGLMLQKNGYFTVASDNGATAPAPVTNASYTISTGVFLKKMNKYPTGESVNLDGNVTFSVVYL